MALLTPMSLDEAKAHARRFGLEVVSLDPIPLGSVNSNFRVGLADGGRAFMRVCEESSHDEVVAQNELLRHLVEQGVRTPAPLARIDGDGTVCEHAGKPLAVFPFCEGESVCQSRVTPEQLEAVGAALARIHLAGEGYAAAPASRFGPAHLRLRLDALQRAHHPGAIAAAVQLLDDRLGDVQSATESLPERFVIHGDVFRDNVLWHEGELTAIVDFESASRGHPAFDLMVTLLAWCFGEAFDGSLIRALVDGYQSERELPSDELGACYDQARAGCVRFAVTRITDYELRSQDVVVHKDYRRFLGRLAAIEAVGRSRFVHWLLDR